MLRADLLEALAATAAELDPARQEQLINEARALLTEQNAA